MITMRSRMIVAIDNAIVITDKLSDKEKSLLQSIVNDCPALYDDIITETLDIFKDRKISLHEIPKVVFIVSKILMKFRLVSDPDIKYAHLIKFIVDAIIESDILPITGFERDIVESIVDTSIDLLSFEIAVVGKAAKGAVAEVVEDMGCCFRFFNFKK